MNGRKGVVAVYNYKTGEILCALTTPTYDPDNVPDIQDGDETYSGVTVHDLLMLAKDASIPKASTNMQVVVAGATDGFHVVLTLCDTDPACRTGESLVADAEDGKAMEKDSAFKLILTEDKKPARWVRNLQSLTVKAVSAD